MSHAKRPAIPAKRINLNNRFVHFVSIAFVVALFLIGIPYVLVSRPDVNAQVALAKAALAESRQARRIVFDGDDITALPFEVSQVEDQKVLFLARMLPLVAAENARITKQRASIEHNPSPAQLNALARAYGLTPGAVDRATLLRRIDVVPESLVLAQSAIESAWGGSRFARQGHAFFGEHTSDPDAPGMKPKRAEGFKIKSFETPQMSVRSYLKTLNTHPAYKAFRLRRATLRALGEHLSGADLAHHLMAYSELGSTYISMITSTIATNGLREFDGLRLSD
ncbi:glucosaminidase domain-containing protein [Magnetovibrio blakemorei]|uniref:Mannosyl-glycoprotein endo-beta-N-acetylglucosamidase-like domain-containing protein n=1 Tax=Magnetovibrio blakemorei TaxID=28181 RepID=A0A1E5Q3J2_9PROT|nr:glucosaminidase domain-containing protein [Magnetovibrio blakemorei]OEJ64061.1 hypothetical protein BEN30_01250 [Magnetovibrio blakemorei]